MALTENEIVAFKRPDLLSIEPKAEIEASAAESIRSDTVAEDDVRARLPEGSGRRVGGIAVGHQGWKVSLLHPPI